VQFALANHLCKVWRQPDEGIWEVRGGAKHFVHSKVMAWVALDRSIEMAEAASGRKVSAAVRKIKEREVRHWRRVRAEIHREVCEKGFNKRLNSFVQAYGPGSTPGALDASSCGLRWWAFCRPSIRAFAAPWRRSRRSS
jgi:GH15 family glucan-1,4-alpha-glucosidase